MKTNRFDLFIDESCHLENDHKKIMGIGYIKVNQEEYSEVKAELLKILHNHSQFVEIKWNKFSKSRVPLYKALVDYFFLSNLQFRAILVKYKDRLKHEDFNQGSHDNFYYKMVYYLLRPNGEEPNNSFRIFIDLKDTRGREKLQKIRDVFDSYYKGDSPFTHFQHLQSHDNLLFQLADFFIGAVTYKSRLVLGEINNPPASKLDFLEYLENKSGFSLEEGTAPWEKKFNIFDHQPKRKN